MATFIWPPEVQWPPPAHILLNYDVVAPGGVLLSSRRDRRGETEEESMTQPYLALITPLGGGGGGFPDNSLPGGGLHPGNRPPGSSPGYPSGQPLPPGGPVDPSYGRPDWGPVDPGWGGGWGGGPHPGNRPPGSGEYPTGGPIVPPQGGTEVPADEYAPLPPPEDIYSQYVVSVWNPKTATWTTKAYPPR